MQKIVLRRSSREEIICHVKYEKAIMLATISMGAVAQFAQSCPDCICDMDHDSATKNITIIPLL